MLFRNLFVGAVYIKQLSDMAHIKEVINNLDKKLTVVQHHGDQYIRLLDYISLLTNGAVNDHKDIRKLTLHYGMSIPMDHAITVKGVTYIDNVASFTIADDLMESISGSSYRKALCKLPLTEKDSLSALTSMEFRIGESFIATAYLNVPEVEQKRTIYYLKSMGEHQTEQMPLVRWLLNGQQRLVQKSIFVSESPTLTLVFFQKQCALKLK